MGGLKQAEVLYLDCKGVGDPARDKQLRDHVGYSPYNLDNMGKSKEWEYMYQEFNRMISERLHSPNAEKVLILTFCKSGRHKSPASGHVLQDRLQHEGLDVVLEHLSEGKFWEGHNLPSVLRPLRAPDFYEKPPSSPTTEAAGSTSVIGDQKKVEKEELMEEPKPVKKEVEEEEKDEGKKENTTKPPVKAPPVKAEPEDEEDDDTSRSRDRSRDRHRGRRRRR